MAITKKKNERAPGDFRHPKRLTVDIVLPLRVTLLDRTHRLIAPLESMSAMPEVASSARLCDGVGV
jgi:hypothetical protein